MKRLLGILIGLLLCGCATRDGDEPRAVRQQFVPVAQSNSASSTSGGATWTALVPAPGEAGNFWIRAFAGVGDTFPVKEKDGPILFQVHVADGDDGQLVLELRSKDGSRRIDLPRDKSAPVQIAGGNYDLAYPSTYVNPTGNATTDRVMLIVTRRQQQSN